jgi:hypothetical protein
MRAGTVNVTGAVGTSLMRGVYCDSTNRVSFRDCNIYATQAGAPMGSAGAIGCETAAADAWIEARSSTISGTGNDISQTAGNIVLGMTDLVNRTANSRGFITTTQASNQTYSLGNSTPGNMGLGTYYIPPGTIIHTNGGGIDALLQKPTPVVFNQPTLVKSINATHGITFANGTTFTVSRLAQPGNPGITSMSVFVPGGTTSTVYNNSSSMRIGTGEVMYVSYTTNIPTAGIIYGDISII